MRDPKEILINGKQLSEILENHKKWLLDQIGGERAALSYADLSSADLSSANLSSADLSYADLSSADLRYADLSYADLRYADLSSADLSYADLRYAKKNELSAALVTITPEGDLIGWKKLDRGLIAKLLIPAKAKRSNATGRKCRAEFAKVLEIWDGDKAVKAGKSKYDDTMYIVGKIVKPNSFDENRWEEYSNGIHFFITKIEAEKY